LVTNDDGIKAEGIKQLVLALQEIGEVNVIAPQSEMSACGHGITVQKPIMVNSCFLFKNVNSWSVSGTPADCIKLGLTELLEKKPDLVVSGINHGPNLGTDVLYSGTVSAAIEAVLLGVPAIAISLDSPLTDDFSLAKQAAQNLCRLMVSKELAPDTLLNVNVPYSPINNIKGYKITKLGERKYSERCEHYKDSCGNDFFRFSGQVLPSNCNDEDLDVNAVKNNYISVTPIHFDLTNYRIMEQVKKWGLEQMGF
jgi:5'-nucleotidase